jgi:hypothetical protein
MSPRSPDEHPDYEAHAVRAEQQAEAVTDVRMAERWRRIAATYRHLAMYRLPESQVSFVPAMSRR